VFALTLTGGFLFLAALGLWRGADILLAVSLAMAVISLLAALLMPGRLTRVRKAWMKMGEAMGRVTTPLLMAVIYYLVVTPIALTRRVVSRRQPPRNSNWHRRPPLPPPSRMERQF
jgi:hypothetical protein